MKDIIKKRKYLDEIKNRKKEMLEDSSNSYAEKLPNYNSDMDLEIVPVPYKKEEDKKLFEKLKNKLK